MLKSTLGATLMLASASLSQAFNADGINYVNYWGQNSYGASGAPQANWQKNLASYCQDSVEDILVLSFLTTFFGAGNKPVLDFSNASNNCTTFDGTTLLNCPQIGEDIKTCQAKGKKIILALGGAAGSYGFTSDSQASGFADTLWDIFGGGSSNTRPFGDAVIDGFDLDIEGGSASGYTAMINQLRTHFASDSSRSYYITGAPQCPFPDAYLGDALSNAWFDFVWVQFYNNYCSVQGGNFNFGTWDNWAKTQSKNPDVKIYLGVPGSTSAASSGYVPYNTLTGTIDSLKSQYSSFGGVMMWDASQAYSNTEVSPNFATAVSSYLHGGQASQVNNNLKTSSTSTGKPASSSTSVKPSSTSSSSSIASPTSKTCPVSGGSCTTGALACSGNSVAICDHEKWVLQSCPNSLVCASSTDGSAVYCNYGSAVQSQSCGTQSKFVGVAANSTNGIPKTQSPNAQVSYFINNVKNNQFQASFNVRAAGASPISNSWTLTFNAPQGQTVQKSSLGTVSQSGNTVTIKANRKKVPANSEAVLIDIVGSHNSTMFEGVDPKSIKFTW
ncbi:glycoside hydrolase superfamily [Umbelopsis sp. AD052]|nr:glycoside hydrolase superfamily [Umbelopsis sp. AD052]